MPEMEMRQECTRQAALGILEHTDGEGFRFGAGRILQEGEEGFLWAQCLPRPDTQQAGCGMWPAGLGIPRPYTEPPLVRYPWG